MKITDTFLTLCEMGKLLIKECNGLKKGIDLLCLEVIRVTKN